MTQTIDEFLRLQGIDQVVVIDDEVPQPMSDECLAALMKLSAEESENVLGGAPPTSKDDAEEIVNDMTPEDVGRVVRQLMHLGHLDTSPDFVEPLLDHEACLFFDETTWGEFVQDARKIGRRRLFVVDRNQKRLEGKAIVRQAHDIPDCAGILYLSSDFDECHSMTALLAKIAADELQEYGVYPFRRKDAVRGDHHEENVLAGFQLAVAGPAIFAMIEPLEKAFREVSQDAFDAFRNQLFLLSCHRLLSTSIPEGIWPPSSYVSYVSDRVQDNVVAHLSKNKSFVQQVRDMATKGWTAGNAVARLMQTVHSENATDDFTFLDPSTNRLPLAPGDIFEVPTKNGVKQYVLLAQECDLAIRANGCRGAVDSAILVPIANGSARDSDSKAPFPPEHAASPIRCVEFAKAISVPMAVLDLCVYNPEGECRANVSIEGVEHWHPAVEKHWPTIQKPLLKAANVIGPMQGKLETAGGITDGMKADIAAFLRHPSDLAAAISFTVENKTVMYGLKRVKRLEASHASMLLQRLSWYRARPATNAALFKGIAPQTQ